MSNLFNHNIFDNIRLDPQPEPMKTGKASGWGVFQYHWVQMPVTDQNQNLDTVSPAIDWCKEYFGKSGSRWFEKQKKFYFKDEKDMALFILKFCS